MMYCWRIAIIAISVIPAAYGGFWDWGTKEDWETAYRKEKAKTDKYEKECTVENMCKDFTEEKVCKRCLTECKFYSNVR